jgi:NAD(P)-dependent dehydrogenase (short-subunit alcohol dehydrogenase family)
MRIKKEGSVQKNMEDIFSLKGKNAVVIGGAGGIGQSIAKGLAFYGANVAIASRKLESLQQAAADIEAEVGKKIKIFQVDSSNQQSIQALVSSVVAEMGSVEVLVNSQGLNIKAPALEFNMDDWQSVFDVNVKGLMMCCMEFAKQMTKQNYGKIINVSSVRGARACGGGNAAYCSSKGAVDMMTRTLAVELADSHITVNAIGPTVTDTPMMMKFLSGIPGIKEKIAASHPLHRMAVSDDCIGAAVFLASDASSYVTGQVIYPDGGLTAVG